MNYGLAELILWGICGVLFLTALVSFFGLGIPAQIRLLKGVETEKDLRKRSIQQTDFYSGERANLNFLSTPVGGQDVNSSDVVLKPESATGVSSVASVSGLSEEASHSLGEATSWLDTVRKRDTKRKVGMAVEETPVDEYQTAIVTSPKLGVDSAELESALSGSTGVIQEWSNTAPTTGSLEVATGYVDSGSGPAIKVLFEESSF